MFFRAYTRTRIDRRPGRRVATRPRLEALETRLAPAAATQLVILTPPPPIVVAGQPFEVTVAAEDALGKIDTSFSLTSVAVGLQSNPGGGALGGSATATFFSGVASFTNLTLTRTGQNYSLLLTSGGLTSPPTDKVPAFTVVAAAPTQLVVTAPPAATVVAGQAFGLTVGVEDQYGNVATNFSGNLAIAPSDITTEGSLGGVLTVAVGANGADPGTAIFSRLSLVKAGAPFTLQVSATGLPTATTSPFSVTAASAAQLGVITPPPTSATAGVGFGLTLAAEDVYGNVVSSESGSDVTVSLDSNPPGVTLAGVTKLKLSGGLASFSGLSLIQAGSGYKLKAITADGLMVPLPSEPMFSVAAGTPSQLALVTSPSTPVTVTAGAPFTIVLAAEDQYGNTVSSLAGNVSLALASNPGGDTLGATSVPFNAGLATFQLTLSKVGTGYSFTAASPNMIPTPAITNLQVNVIPAPASQLVVTSGPPVAVTTGQTFGLTVTAEDPYGNTATSFNGNVAVAPSNNGIMGNLGGPLTAKASGGVADFSGLSLSKSGSPFTLQVTSTGLPLAVTSPFTVSSGQATQLVVIAAPSTVAVGTGFELQVAAEDPYGNIDASFGGTVTLSLASNPAGANLGGAVSATAVGGVATFSGLTLDALGSGETLLAKTTGLASVTTGSIAVVASGGTNTGVGSSPGGGNSDGGSATTGGDTTGGGSSGSPSTSSSSPVPAPHLVISNQPATVTAGRYFQIALVVEDAQDRVETNFTGKVTVALASDPTGAVLGGNLAMPVQKGLLTFYGLTLDRAGSGYTIQATASGFNSAVSSPITVVDPPSVVGPPPSSVAVHQAFGLSVAIEGVSGSLVPDYSGKVTIALVRKRGGVTLRGPRTVQAVGGVAQFSRLSLSGARKGSAVLLRITADGVGNAATVVLSIPAATRAHGPRKGVSRR